MNPTLKKQQLRKARIVTLAITAFGIAVLVFLNWNVDLVVHGNKFEGTVIERNRSTGESNRSFHYVLTIEFIKNSDIISFKKKDNTRSFSCVDEGDTLNLYASTSQPSRYYVPAINATASLFVLFFFVFIPLLFAVIGK